VEETFPTPYVYIFVIRILYIFLISIKYIFFIRITDPDQEFIYFRGSETLPSAYILSEKPTLRVTGIMKDEGNDDEMCNMPVSKTEYIGLTPGLS